MFFTNIFENIKKIFLLLQESSSAGNFSQLCIVTEENPLKYCNKRQFLYNKCIRKASEKCWKRVRRWLWKSSEAEENLTLFLFFSSWHLRWNDVGSACETLSENYYLYALSLLHCLIINTRQNSHSEKLLMLCLLREVV